MSEVRLLDWGILPLILITFVGFYHLSNQLAHIATEILSTLNEIKDSLSNIENRVEKIELNQKILG
ncbi:MAG: hypothetical protein V1766_04150 [Pseudomonadota bacterium]